MCERPHEKERKNEIVILTHTTPIKVLVLSIHGYLFAAMMATSPHDAFTTRTDLKKATSQLAD